MFEDTKFIKKELLSMFLMANEASLGIFGLCFMISKDKSLIDSMAALNASLWPCGATSATALILAVI